MMLEELEGAEVEKDEAVAGVCFCPSSTCCVSGGEIAHKHASVPGPTPAQVGRSSGQLIASKEASICHSFSPESVIAAQQLHFFHISGWCTGTLIIYGSVKLVEYVIIDGAF